ncbi:dihydroxyacetone kinase subunit DhaK [Actinoplanes sp. LDG1-06]|uniref:Dihydroxyacetone kinase subunit DhaK n=1 Tax=Paractinoplanes ovalisporus TaxID=2810368 RepID=A0ABS2A507_9ACTN|nr:dihydroxyacetone kinase subunit DhaK [Actinoplanes ovalisporus]MBM2614882.1 dihydroxyacetone kinase subunit DhaK [Actinoplanes ovalisporus]
MAEPFLDSSSDYVDRALAGFALDHRDIVDLHDNPAFVRAKATAPGRRVGLVSGGGSGHEPMHAGFVGAGMLDAAVPGKVFASPHNRQIYEASRAVAGPDGVLHIVKNYTGDRINFGIAAERLAHDGIPVARVLVDDDVATESEKTATGRRGTAATIVVEKLLGAAADRGDDLDSLAKLGSLVASASRSVAVASLAHTSPVTGELAFPLPEGEIEYGVGIHGERAAQSIARPPLPALVSRMTTEVLGKLPAGDRAIVLVNGLGGTTSIELYNVFALVAEALHGRGVEVAGSLVGTLSPALDMKGFSITVTIPADDWIGLWDAPARTAALRK